MIAVIGATGQLGSAFVRALGSSARPVTRAELDLSDIAAIEPFIDLLRPELVINCAAYTAVDAAENDSEAARTINAVAVGKLSEATARHNSELITFSTDYVFDGKKESGYVESDDPSPVNVYGQTKREGEMLALEAHPGALVIRTSWLLSTAHPNFITTILEKLSQGVVAVVDDQRGRPTVVDDLVRGTLEARRVEASGILHLTNEGETTWFDLARKVASSTGFDPSRVQPISSADLDRPARRPSNSVLDSERLEGLGIEGLPPWRKTVSAMALELAAFQTSRRQKNQAGE